MLIRSRYLRLSGATIVFLYIVHGVAELCSLCPAICRKPVMSPSFSDVNFKRFMHKLLYVTPTSSYVVVSIRN
jgi:hypothetical protein